MSYKPTSEFLHVMMTRGYVADCTDLEGLDTALKEGKPDGGSGEGAEQSATIHDEGELLRDEG